MEFSKKLQIMSGKVCKTSHQFPWMTGDKQTYANGKNCLSSTRQVYENQLEYEEIANISLNENGHQLYLEKKCSKESKDSKRASCLTQIRDNAHGQFFSSLEVCSPSTSKDFDTARELLKSQTQFSELYSDFEQADFTGAQY